MAKYTYTVKEIKEMLPRVHVNYKGKVVMGRVVGRKNKYATVHTPIGSWEFSWQSVTRAYNNNSILRAY